MVIISFVKELILCYSSNGQKNNKMSKSDDRVYLHEESPCSIGQDAG